MSGHGIMEEMLIYLRRIAEALERIEAHLQPVSSSSLAEVSSAIDELSTVRVTEGEQEQTGEAHLQPVSSPSLAEVSSAIDELSTVRVTEGEQEQTETPQATTASNKLIQWLEDRKIKVRSYRVLPSQDEPLDWFARFLGERFDNLHPFYDKWKKAINQQWGWFKISMKDFPPNQISDIVQFAYRLYQYAMLENLNYARSSRTLSAKAVMIPDVINFVTGGWLERYISRLVKSTIERLGFDLNEIAIISNIQIVLPNQSDAEIDILIGNEATQIWFECKTSEEYQTSVKSWKGLSRYLRIPKERAGVVLLIPPESPQVSEWLESQIGMTVLRLNEVSAFLERAFQSTQG